MGEALARIKRELGPDAVILSSRAISEPSPDGIEKLVEVVAASQASLDRKQEKKLSMSTLDGRASLLERRLIDSGVPVNAARTLSMRVKRDLREGDASLIDALARALRAELSFGGGRRARVQALVGPTGVGKTTTIAKLAAVSALVEHRVVALICLDQYRIGASDQLARYADLIGIPMETASCPATFDRALARLARAEVVLVDTSGRSPRDTVGIGLTADTLRSAREPVEVHLCIPASLREVELRGTIERQSAATPSRVIVTKLDEANFCGGVISAYVHSGLPISYVTTGQRVPEDIDAATPEGLARMLCSEEVQ